MWHKASAECGFACFADRGGFTSQKKAGAYTEVCIRQFTRRGDGSQGNGWNLTHDFSLLLCILYSSATMAGGGGGGLWD